MNDIARRLSLLVTRSSSESALNDSALETPTSSSLPDPASDPEPLTITTPTSTTPTSPTGRKSKHPHHDSLIMFDVDQALPVSPRKVDPSFMFGDLQPDTPASAALKAVSELKPSRLDKYKLGGTKLNTLARKRPRMKNLTRDVKAARRKRRSHIKGKKIDGKHEQYALSMGMMLGIRVSVGNTEQGSKVGDQNKHKMELADFMQVAKYSFPPGGNSSGPHITPPHRLSHTFKFKAYSPLVFEKIRTMFGVGAAHFMLSICGNYNFIEFISNAKSGQFFFYSHDGRYMIKTQTDAESRFLRRIMPHYYQYLIRNPHTTITHFYGMYRVRMAHLRRNVHFVIMKSVFNTDKRIHSMWDLKGSTVGRLSSPEESVMKDLNIVNDCTKIKIGKDKKEMLMNQLRSDVKFLAKLDIMDYSLLLGRHDRKKLVEERLIAEEEYRQSKVLKMKMKMKKAEESDRNNNDGNVKRSDTPMRRTRRASYIENSDILAVNKDFNNDRARRATDNDIAAIAAAAITVNSELEEISSNSNGGSFNEKELSSNSTDESYYGESDESEYDDEENCDGESDSIVSSEAVTLVNDENENEDENDSDNKIANSRNSNTSSARLSSLRTADSGETAHDTLRRNTDDHIKVMSLVEGEHQLPNPWTKRRDLGVESKIKLDVGIYNLGGGGDRGDEKEVCEEIYFMGIIDILQQYNTRKQSETFFKGLMHNSKEISCVHPDLYGERFLLFVEKLFE